MEKIINLSGRIDATNVGELEENIDKEIVGADEIVFDAKDLEYISSAGLRVILKIKKAYDNTKIINCNNDVYNIFDMTGFTQMMMIEKKLREISVDDCEVIGEGFYGLVYRIDPETIVKVYKKGNSIDMIKREIDLAKKAFVMGIPTAIAYDIVRVGDSYGAVFELLNAKSYLSLILEGCDIEPLVKTSVEILKKIHATVLEDNELPSKKQEKIEVAKYCAQFLSKESGEKLVKLLEDIPEVNTMLHGDYHIKNLMKQNDETLLIDMNTISMGHPIFELGAIFATYYGFACVDKNNPKDFLGIDIDVSKKILDLTYKYYFDNKTEEEIKEIMEKAKIISYMQVLFLRDKYKSSPMYEEEIKWCINYLEENVKNIESLTF